MSAMSAAPPTDAPIAPLAPVERPPEAEPELFGAALFDSLGEDEFVGDGEAVTLVERLGNYTLVNRSRLCALGLYLLLLSNSPLQQYCSALEN